MQPVNVYIARAQSPRWSGCAAYRRERRKEAAAGGSGRGKARSGVGGVGKGEGREDFGQPMVGVCARLHFVYRIAVKQARKVKGGEGKKAEGKGGHGYASTRPAGPLLSLLLEQRGGCCTKLYHVHFALC